MQLLVKTNQLLSKTTILHRFSAIRDVIDVSHKLNSNLAWISLNFLESFTEYIRISTFVRLFYHKFVIRKFILPFLSLVMETNPLLHTPISNLRLKKWSPVLTLAGSYKKWFIKQDKWYDHNFPLRYFGYILIILSLITPVGTKSHTCE